MANEMRDRLVEILGDECCTKPISCDICEYKDFYDCHNYARADRLIENGVVVLPCKVGDAVYIIGLDKKIEKYSVEGVCLYQNGLFIEILYNGQGFSLPFNKVFITKEQAEQKLKEMRDNDDL